VPKYRHGKSLLDCTSPLLEACSSSIRVTQPYETGIGVERSPSKAYAWYLCAIQSASNNSTAANKDHNTEAEILKDAKGSFDKMKDGLSAADVEMGRNLAAEYIARYGKSSP
jgi:hypothetical protein